MTEADFLTLKGRGSTSRRVLALDPDIEKTGLAVIDRVERAVVEARSVPTADLLLELKFNADRAKVSSRIEETELPVVVIEAGWKVKDVNFHGTQGSRRAQRVAHDVGENHAAGKLTAAFARRVGYEVVEHYPLKKSWSGKERKITARELESLTGYKERTNQDVRDAILLGWTFSGLPMVVDSRFRVGVDPATPGGDKTVSRRIRIGPDGRLIFDD